MDLLFLQIYFDLSLSIVFFFVCLFVCLSSLWAVLLPTWLLFFYMELWLANFVGKEQSESSKGGRLKVKLVVDFSSKHYLFCEYNSVKIGQNIQN